MVNNQPTAQSQRKRREIAPTNRQATQLSQSTISKPKRKIIRKMIELGTVTFITWLDPGAWLMIAVVKFCFLLLDLLQQEEQEH